MGKEIDINEIQKDISDYISRKYGIKMKIAGVGPFPETEKDGGSESGSESRKGAASIRFDMKPGELKAYLDEYMVKQDDAKQVLATKICTHYNRIKRFELNRRKKRPEAIGEIKNNIIMIGPTGVGKTYLVKLIASRIGVPFVKGDATKFSETGYVGGDVEDLVRDLVHEADGDIELAQYGIIYLDEIDKIASSHNIIGPDVSRTGVQRALLKPLEDTEVELKVPHDPVSQLEAMHEYQKTGKREKKKISTKHILFIMSGAFNGLEEIIGKRLNRQGIGFGAKIQVKGEHAENVKHVKAEDLIRFGFESEFIGRLPVVTVFEPLETGDLYKILINPKNPIIIGKKRDFKAYGIDLQFEDEALHRIAENAFREGTGARGLVSAVERVLMKFEHTLPSTDIKYLTVSSGMVANPEKELETILAEPDDPARGASFQRLMSQEEKRLEDYIHQKIPEWRKSCGITLNDERISFIVRYTLDRQSEVEYTLEEIKAADKSAREFAGSFSDRNGLEITFSDDAVNLLAEKAGRDAIDIPEHLKSSFQNYDHGLKLIREKTGKKEFVITAAGIEDPETYLNRLIQEAYK